MLEMLCPKCGKNFIRAPQHIYRDEKGFYCSWTCYNHRNDKASARKRKCVELLSMNGTLLKVFTSATDAAEATGFDYKKIQHACKEELPYYGYLWRYRK